MDTELDLATASRETLLAVIAELKATVAQLQQRVVGLEGRLNTRGSFGMPGNKPPSRRPAPRKPARKRRPHGFARIRMAPTQRVEHAVEAFQIVEPTWLGDGCSGPGKSLRFQWSRSRSPSMSLWRAIVRCVRGAGCPRWHWAVWWWASSAGGSTWSA